MKRGTIGTVFGAVALAGFTLAGHAEIKENPYQIIIDRNPFGLRPIPPPVETKKEEPVPPAPLPDIKLTGITDLLGQPQVMLQVENKQAKSPAEKFSFPTLAQGETEGGITVLAIDMNNMTARIKNGENEATLDFKKDGVKPGAGAVASAAVPHPGAPVPALAHPGAVPQPPVSGIAPNQAAANNGTGRSAIVSGGSQPAGAVGASGVANYGGLPPRPLRTDSPANSSLIMAGGGQTYNPNPQPTVSHPTMSREEAEARIEAARRMLQEKQAAGQVVPHSPNILPPTSLGRALNGGIPAPPGR